MAWYHNYQSNTWMIWSVKANPTKLYDFYLVFIDCVSDTRLLSEMIYGKTNLALKRSCNFPREKLNQLTDQKDMLYYIHPTPTELSCHVQFFLVITLLESRWETRYLHLIWSVMVKTLMKCALGGLTLSNKWFFMRPEININHAKIYTTYDAWSRWFHDISTRSTNNMTLYWDDVRPRPLYLNLMTAYLHSDRLICMFCLLGLPHHDDVIKW